MFNFNCYLKNCIIVVLCLLASSAFSAEIEEKGAIRVPIRGGTLDVHFNNLTASVLSAEAFFYNNGKKVPIPDKRNLIFIPNSGSKSKPKEMPVSFKLKPAVVFEGDRTFLKGQHFIQGIMIYNNMSTYDIGYYNGGYNRDERYTTYSSYMWSHGVRAPDDGNGVFSNAIDEFGQIKYKLSMKIDDDYSIAMNLIFKGISNLKSKDETKEESHELRTLKDVSVMAAQIAAFTKIASGIASSFTNPPAGILVIVSGAFNEVQAVTQFMINSYLGERVITLSDKGHSWLSSPFDVLIIPEDFYIYDSKNNIIGIADYNRHKGQLLFFLGNEVKPEYLVVNLRTSEKGDLFVSFISSSAYKAENAESLLSNSEFDKVKPKKK